MTDSIFVKYMKTKTFRNIPATLRWLHGEYKVEKREKEEEQQEKKKKKKKSTGGPEIIEWDLELVLFH